MPKVHLYRHNGSHVELRAEAGKSLMQAATGAGIAGIVGECGGSAMCATCHVYVRAPWQEKLTPPSAPELEMLDCTTSERRPESRLSCQIKLSQDLDGLTVELPETQQ